jgi:L-aminopeptidase/D-esterase-like protein
VRGSSPGTREVALLGSEKSAREVHAVLLTGGSSFGLAAADGVMRFLEERDVGYRTPWAVVPIVPAAVIYDLNTGDPAVRPGAMEGYAACGAAREGTLDSGALGAGTGATVGKWAGIEGCMRGGLGASAQSAGELHVAALVVVNAVGDVVDELGAVIAGARTADGRWRASDDPLRPFSLWKSPAGQTNTTVAAVLTNARLSKVDANRVASRTHNGLARAIRPVHTSYDGDTVFALASCATDASLDLVAEIAVETVASAIRAAVGHDLSAPPPARPRAVR